MQPALHCPDHQYLPDAQGTFSLTLRATQGLLDSLFELMQLCDIDQGGMMTGVSLW